MRTGKGKGGSVDGDVPWVGGDEPFADRSDLRAVVWELSAGLCEHVVTQLGLTDDEDRYLACGQGATELAHIQPRGMGHRGDRDTINNTMAACDYHARSTDDMTSDAWVSVAAWAGASPGREERVAYRSWLRQWVLQLRQSKGWDL